MMIRLEFEALAEPELKGAIEQDPKLPQAHLLLGQMALFRGRLDEAVALTEREIAINPTNAMAFSQIGDARVRQGRWDEAVAALQKSLWLNPFYSAPYILLGKAYLQKGQPATAEGMLTRAIQYDPNNRSAHYLLGQVLQRIGRLDEAKREFAIAERLQDQPGRSIPFRSSGPFLPVPSALFGVAMALAAPAAQEKAVPWPVTFTDIAARAGLREPGVYGGVDRKRFIIETNGAGVALVDYDRDGWLDALVLGDQAEGGDQGGLTYPAGTRRRPRLYRNRRDGTFEDVTDAAGLRRTGWASSVCAGDYDNDGWTISSSPPTAATCSIGTAGTFEDVTAQAGLAVAATSWGSGCTFVDYDRDGTLDLFVSNYLRFDLATAAEPGAGANCRWKGVPVNCGPKGLPTDTNLLYRNRGDGTFADVSDASGVSGSRDDLDDGRRDGPRRRRVAGHLRRRPIRPPQSCPATITTAGSRTPPSRAARGPARTATRRPGWAWPSATTTATDGSICSRRTSQTTPRRSTAASGRGCSKTWRVPRGSPSITGTWSGARACSTSTTTACRICST